MFRMAWIVLFLLALGIAGAQAAPAKKKSYRRAAKPAAVNKVSAPAPAPVPDAMIGGSNVYGRTGLLFTETAQTIQTGHASATGNLLYWKSDQLKVYTIPEIGANYGISRERARQLEKRLLDKLKVFLRAELGDAVEIAMGPE